MDFENCSNDPDFDTSLYPIAIQVIKHLIATHEDSHQLHLELSIAWDPAYMENYSPMAAAGIFQALRERFPLPAPTPKCSQKQIIFNFFEGWCIAPEDLEEKSHLGAQSKFEGEAPAASFADSDEYCSLISSTNAGKDLGVDAVDIHAKCFVVERRASTPEEKTTSAHSDSDCHSSDNNDNCQFPDAHVTRVSGVDEVKVCDAHVVNVQLNVYDTCLNHNKDVTASQTFVAKENCDQCRNPDSSEAISIHYPQVTDARDHEAEDNFERSEEILHGDAPGDIAYGAENCLDSMDSQENRSDAAHGYDNEVNDVGYCDAECDDLVDQFHELGLDESAIDDSSMMRVIFLTLAISRES